MRNTASSCIRYTRENLSAEPIFPRQPLHGRLKRNHILKNTITSRKKQKHKRQTSFDRRWTPSLKVQSKGYIPSLNNSQVLPPRSRNSKNSKSVSISTGDRLINGLGKPRNKRLVNMSVINPYMGSFSNVIPSMMRPDTVGPSLNSTLN